MPRPGVLVDMALALADNDSQLLSAGITTAFLSATDSWEPGLRSRETLRRLLAVVANVVTGPAKPIHVRHERSNVDDLAELVAWIQQGDVAFLSFNDHTQGKGGDAQVTPKLVDRSGVGHDVLERLLAHAITSREAGLEQEVELARAAAEAGCPTASHDAMDHTHLERDVALGVAVAEFPFTIELAHAYRDAGIAVMFGAPNLVRGGSHIGNLSVGEALAENAGDVLVSDYHYPSLLQAPFVASELGAMSFGQAWQMVSHTPAEAAGLTDRGELRGRSRADVVVVEPPVEGRPARVRAVVVDGRVEFSAAAVT